MWCYMSYFWTRDENGDVVLTESDYPKIIFNSVWANSAYYFNGE